MTTRFHESQDGRITLDSLLDEILVICPRCQKCALVLPNAATSEMLMFHSRRLVCAHCGLAKEWTGHSVSFGWWQKPPTEPYFGQTLWLATPCCGDVLWAFNARHLELIEQYVGADLREKRRHPQLGWFNQSLFNRMPRWIKAAHNRQQVLRAIRRLRSTRLTD